MKFLPSPIQFGKYPGMKFTPIDGETNYLSINILEIPVEDMKPMSEANKSADEPLGDEVDTTEDLSQGNSASNDVKVTEIRKVVIFDLKEGREIQTKIQTRASKKKNPKIGDFFTFEEVVPQMVYQSEPIEDPSAVLRLEAFLLANAI